MSPDTSILALKPNDTLGKYTITRLAGRGGMGVVYEAKDPTIGRRVAIKMLLLPESIPEEKRVASIARFRQEARAAGNLSHPNIVTIYSVETMEDRDFIVMEFVPGPTLKDELDQGGPVSLERALRLASQVCAALGHAHQHGVVHRDVKPANLFLGEQDRCKLGDFGIAQLDLEATDSPGSSRPAGAGSLGYMSPEQMLRYPLDARSDIFSLGVTLVEMLSGKPMFSDLPRDQIVQSVRSRAFETPGGLPPEIERLLLKALSFAPEERQQTAEELARDLATAQTALEAEHQGLVLRDPKAQRKVKLLSKAVCSFHPISPAVELCAVCGKPICVSCLRMKGESPQCFKCCRPTIFAALTSRLVANNLVFYAAAALLVLAILAALRFLR